MSNYTEGVGLDDLADQFMTEATEAHLDIEENRDEVHDTFDRLISEAIIGGFLRLSPAEQNDLLRRTMWARASQRAGQRTKNMLTAMYRGQLTVDGIHEAMNLTVTAGVGRRTTLRHLDTIDVRRITAERVANREKVIASADLMVDHVAPWLTDLLTTHGSLDAALRAGAVETAEAA